MRTIDGDALKEQFKDKEGDTFTAFHFYEAIDKMQTIEERKIGRWSVNEVGVVRCPFCHANMNPRKNRRPKYCDECGARMLSDNEGEKE